MDWLSKGLQASRRLTTECVILSYFLRSRCFEGFCFERAHKRTIVGAEDFHQSDCRGKHVDIYRLVAIVEIRCVAISAGQMPQTWPSIWVAVISAKKHKRQRRKRQSVNAKREKSQTPKVLTAILTLHNLT